jgi:UDP-N-acetylmuramate--alanine ligase
VNFSQFRNIYFLGIGGIGMSALARYFNSIGKNVSGYDKTSTPLTDELINEGIDVHFTDDVKLISKRILDGERKQTLVVYTPAIPSHHYEYNFFRSNDFIIKKRSEVLGMLTENTFTIAVAGTHGKTTTSSMIAHLLNTAGLNCSAFLGGISKNFNSNLLLSHSAKGEAIVVVEADEYDRSFLALSPSISVITSMDADHLDIYGNEKYMIESYRMFAEKLKSGGNLVYRKGLPLDDLKLNKSSYSVNNHSDYSAMNIRIGNHRYEFDWKNSNSSILNLSSDMPGMHNVENAIAAIAVARLLKVPEEIIRKAISSYSGVKRRFDYQVRNSEIVYIDDYAHHPEELRACISSVRELYPSKKITGIFQPHLFTRTRDFAEGFSKSLSLLDSLILLDIYPAREEPLPGITSEIIFEKVRIKDKVLTTKENVLNELKKRTCEVVLTLGAGDIDQLVKPIREYLINNTK